MSGKAVFTVTNISDGIWEINQGNDRLERYVDAYLVCGEEKALLIDCLMDEGGLLEIIRNLTSLPVEVAITHGHGDHAGKETANLAKAGYAIYMDQRDKETLKGMFSCEYDSNIFNPLKDGQVFDLGGRKLEVISVPGHTVGSVVLLDRENQIMFSGDTIGSGIIWMQIPHSVPLDNFLEGLKNLEKEVVSLDNLRIYPGHLYQAINKLDKHFVTEMRELTEDLVSGKVVGIPIQEEYTASRFPGSLQVSRGIVYRYCYNPNNIY